MSRARARHARRRLIYLIEAPLRRRSIVLVPVLALGIVAGVVAQRWPDRYRAAALIRADWDVAVAAEIERRGVALDERHVRVHAGTRVLEEHRVGVEGDDPARGADAPAQQVHDAHGAAAEVQAAPAGGDADALEQDAGVELERRRLHAQALDLARAPLDRVAAREHPSGSARR